MNLADLPAVNASLNAVAAVLLTLGWIFIRYNKVTAHRICMGSAFAVSALFLTCYLVYHFQFGRTDFPDNAWKPLYLAILIPHIILAVVMLPLIFRTFYLALTDQFEKHRRIARWTLPIWLYVSVTGVLVYIMLYRIPW